eukprot:3135778-Rhodomonas_salina.1
MPTKLWVLQVSLVKAVKQGPVLDTFPHTGQPVAALKRLAGLVTESHRSRPGGVSRLHMPGHPFSTVDTWKQHLECEADVAFAGLPRSDIGHPARVHGDRPVVCAVGPNSGRYSRQLAAVRPLMWCVIV